MRALKGPRDVLGGPRPRVEPNYREESRFWRAVDLTVKAVPMVVFLVSFALGQREVGALTGALTLVAFFSTVLSIVGSPAGNYYLAVNFVNSVDIREWAYCNGVAVAVLPDDLAVILDTRYRRLYLVRWSSLRLYPLQTYGRARLRVNPLTKPQVARLGCLQGRRAVILWGYIEAPSVRRAGEVAVIHGTFVMVRLGLAVNPKHLRGLSSCSGELADLVGG